MIGKTILEVTSPVTQAADAVKQLIAFYNHGLEPAEMPTFFRLSAEMVLVQSKKKDGYYVVTPKSCSCPASTYCPGRICKHRRTYFNSVSQDLPMSLDPVKIKAEESRRQAREYQAHQRALMAQRLQGGERGVSELIIKGGFRPVLEAI